MKLSSLLSLGILLPVLLISYPFGSANGVSVGVHPHGVAVADLNGDGKTDLISANTSSGDVSVLLGNGNGTFSSPANFPVQERPKFVVVGDLNNDGKLDLAAANETSNSVTVLLGNGNGTFQTAINSPAGCSKPHEIAIGELNGDNKLDVVIPCWDGTVVSVLYGLGNGSFQPAVNYTTGSGPHSAVISDLNKDGRNDIAVANFFNNSMSVLLANASGGFAPAVNYATGVQPHFVRTADLNKDGNIDLFTANDGSNNVSVFLGGGTGTFAAASNYATGQTPESVGSADINGDGNLDLFTANSAGFSVSVLLGTGTGTFAAPQNFPVGNTPFHALAAEFDGDNKLDIAVANYGSDNVSLLLSSTTNSVPPGATYLSDRSWTSATNGYGPVEKDKSNGDSGSGDGLPITINGTGYAKGLGVHADSDIRYSVAGCTTFITDVGVDDEVGSNGSVLFQIWTDGVKVFDSGTMTGSSIVQRANISLANKSELRLVVTNAGDGSAYDHADWANAAVVCSADTTPPFISQVSPASGATNVSTTAKVTATFSEAMNASTITSTSFILTPLSSSTPVTAQVTYDAATFTAMLTPSAALTAGTSYMATVKGGAAGVKDASSNPLGSDYSWIFTVGAQPPQYLSDRQWTSAINGWGPVERDRSNGDSASGDGFPLRLNGVTYAKGLGVHAGSDVRFNISGCTTFSAMAGVDDEVGNFGSVVFQVWLDGVKAFESPVMTGASSNSSVALSLSGKTELRLVVTDAGNGIDYDHADWADAQLTCAADTTPPMVTSVSPTPGASGVSPSTAVQVTFSEPMNGSTISASTVLLTRQGTTTPITATVSYDAANLRATLTPTTALLTSSTYQFTVKGGSAGVKDAANNPLSSDYISTFTTSASAGTISYLSDRTWVSATNGWGPVEKDRANGDSAANDGLPIRLNGVVFARGLGVHADSDITYNVAGCSALTASIGVDDEVGTEGSVVFQVWLDGVKAFDSGVMTGSSSTQQLNVVLSGKSLLRLVVTNAGDNYFYDHADWADAKLTCN